jgi:hypothetical protein
MATFDAPLSSTLNVYGVSDLLNPPLPKFLPAELPTTFAQQFNIPSCAKVMSEYIVCNLDRKTDAFCQFPLSQALACKTQQHASFWKGVLQFERQLAAEQHVSPQEAKQRMEHISHGMQLLKLYEELGRKKQDASMVVQAHIDYMFGMQRIVAFLEGFQQTSLR